VRTAATPSGLADGLDAGLLADARFVASPRLLAALHAELRRSLGDAEARITLVQAGCYHGYRDALAVARDLTPRSRRGDGPAACAAPLVPFDIASAFDAHGERLRGTWPQRGEAEAVLLACGAAHAPACLVSAGYTSGWLSALRGVETLAVEVSCCAAGDAACRFEARDAAAWRALGDAQAIACLDALPWGAQRDAIERERAAEGDDAEEAFDPESPAVHVWGPVMVVPYAGEETAVAIEAVSRDPGAAGVSVVIVDLGGAVIDDGFGAAALERVIDVIHGWGAEALLTGVAAHAARVVAGLAGAPVMVSKDLRAAIATAFQIAESQRRTS
jgi:hypothetical protein